jgi:hypothetical protein
MRVLAKVSSCALIGLDGATVEVERASMMRILCHLREAAGSYTL